MRATAMVAGLAITLAACGGGNKAADQQTTTSDQQQAQPAPSGEAAAPAGGGATHEVKMELDGAKYKFDPAELTIKSGDVVKFVDVSGGPHNVSFWADSVPSGGADALKAGMPDQMSELSGPLLTEPNSSYTVTFAKAPAGVYKFYCLPHLATGMKGQVTVQ